MILLTNSTHDYDQAMQYPRLVPQAMHIPPHQRTHAEHVIAKQNAHHRSAADFYDLQRSSTYAARQAEQLTPAAATITIPVEPHPREYFHLQSDADLQRSSPDAARQLARQAEHPGRRVAVTSPRHHNTTEFIDLQRSLTDAACQADQLTPAAEHIIMPNDEVIRDEVLRELSPPDAGSTSIGDDAPLVWSEQQAVRQPNAADEMLRLRKENEELRAKEHEAREQELVRRERERAQSELAALRVEHQQRLAAMEMEYRRDRQARDSASRHELASLRAELKAEREAREAIARREDERTRVTVEELRATLQAEREMSAKASMAMQAQLKMLESAMLVADRAGADERQESTKYDMLTSASLEQGSIPVTTARSDQEAEPQVVPPTAHVAASLSRRGPLGGAVVTGRPQPPFMAPPLSTAQLPPPSASPRPCTTPPSQSESSVESDGAKEERLASIRRRIVSGQLVSPAEQQLLEASLRQPADDTEVEREVESIQRRLVCGHLVSPAELQRLHAFYDGAASATDPDTDGDDDARAGALPPDYNGYKRWPCACGKLGCGGCGGEGGQRCKAHSLLCCLKLSKSQNRLAWVCPLIRKPGSLPTCGFVCWVGAGADEGAEQAPHLSEVMAKPKSETEQIDHLMRASAMRRKKKMAIAAEEPAPEPDEQSPTFVSEVVSTRVPIVPMTRPDHTQPPLPDESVAAASSLLEPATRALVDAMSTEEGYAELHALFATLDKDGDGTVTSKEWGKAVTRNKVLLAKYFGDANSSPKEIGQAFRRLDIDGSGDLSWEEIEAGVAALRSLSLASAPAAILPNEKSAVDGSASAVDGSAIGIAMGLTLEYHEGSAVVRLL